MASSVRPHLPEDELHAHADGEFSPSQRAEISEHLLSCLICRSAQAEVMVLRERTSDLLARASPTVGRRLSPPLPIQAPVVAPPRWYVRRGALIAAGLATLIGGVWYTLQQPTGHALVATSTITSTALASREWRRSPFDAPPETAAAITSMVDPYEADPAPGWEPVDLPTAVKLARGAVPVLEGLPLSSIKIGPNTISVRPTLLARFVLPDGRSVWVLAGAREELPVVQSLLLNNGLTVSAAQEAGEDSIVTAEAIHPTVRMVTLAGNLPVDSLNVLVGKIRLKL